MKMSLLKSIFLCIALFISVHSTSPFPDVPHEYVSNECREKARTFNISKEMSLPLRYNSVQFCMYQNLKVLEKMKSLHLALTTPQTGRSICRIEVHLFNETARTVNMTIYDTDLRGSCIPRNATIVKAREGQGTKELSELEIPRKLGWERTYEQKEDARLLFTDYKECLILFTTFSYGRTGCVWPNPAGSSSSERFLYDLGQLRLLVRTPLLKEDTIFMNEFQAIPEVFYQIPEANMYASTYPKIEPRLCGIKTYKILPVEADLELKMIISGRNQSIEGNYLRFHSDMNAISPTQISLPNPYGRCRVLVSNFKNCYVFKKVDSSNSRPPCTSCEFFLKNNANPNTELEECWFVFLAYCGYPKAFYKETSCYS